MGSVQREGEAAKAPQIGWYTGKKRGSARSTGTEGASANGRWRWGGSAAGANFDCGEGSVWWRWWRQRVLRSIARPRAAETADGREEGSCGTCRSISVHGRSRDLLQSGLWWWMAQGTEEEGPLRKKSFTAPEAPTNQMCLI
jgi:hypothetical protein